MLVLGSVHENKLHRSTAFVQQLVVQRRHAANKNLANLSAPLLGIFVQIPSGGGKGRKGNGT